MTEQQNWEKQFQNRIIQRPLVSLDEIGVIVKRHQHILQSTVKDERKALFPVRSSINIPEASYVLKMPTVEGREAIVIFPPGESALQDIEFMLAGENSEGPAIHKLRRVVLSTNGCKFSLSKVD